jgi:hypothetical protein
MRAIDPAWTDKLTPSRQFDARMTFRDNRLIFTTRALADSLGLSDPSTADACLSLSGTEIWRCVNSQQSGPTGPYELYWQQVDPPSDPNWSNWINLEIELKAGSRPGIETGWDTTRIWYQKSNGDVCYIEYDQVEEEWGVEQVMTSDFAAYVVTCAPPQYAEPLNGYCYIHYLEGIWGAIAKLNTNGDYWMWNGRVYGNITTARYFDAVRIDDWDYLYFADDNNGRILTTKCYRSAVDGYGDTSYVMPLDVVDDTSFLRLSYASKIDNKVWITGRLSRKSEYTVPVAFDVYTVGPDNFTMGRDMYIAQEDIGGKLFLIGETLYYVGVNTVAEAPATMLVGVDNAAKKLETQKFSGFSLDCSPNGPSVASIALDPSEAGEIIRRGTEGVIEVGLGGEWATLATIGIDAVQPSWEQEGQTINLISRGMAMKKLEQWISDQSYDYWSQAKQSSDPAELSEVIRPPGGGTWEGPSGGPLSLSELNIDGVLYMAAKASRGGSMRAKFYKAAGDWTPHYGVAANYYVETREDASIRLEIDIDQVTNADIGHNGIVAIWGPTEYSSGPDTPGVGLYLWRSSVFYKLAEAALEIPDDAWNWLEIDFKDGLIEVYYRADADTAWTQALTYIYDNQDYIPWKRECFGRGALYVNNGTVHSSGPGFTSTDMIIPVEDNSEFPASETVIVDEEKIDYDGKSPMTGPTGPLAYAEGFTLAQAPHDNTYFQDLTLVEKLVNKTPANFIIGTASEIGRGWPLPHDTQITKVRYRIKRTTDPLVGSSLYCKLCTDDYDNDAPPPASAVLDEDSIPVEDLPYPNYDWVEFDFGSAPWVPADNYFAMLYEAPFNDYHLRWQTDNTPPLPFSLVRQWNGVAWVTIDGYSAAIQVIGNCRWGNGYEIYISPRGVPTDRNALQGMALVVTSGPGQGSVFEINEYDWQAPDQWVPSQEYASPDTWQDHVGDPAHGAWVTPDLSRFFVTTDPNGMIGEGSVLQVYPALIVDTRGVDDTSVTSHGEGPVSVFRDVSVQTNRVEFYSSNPDLSMEDMIRELGNKAGIAIFDFDLVLDETVDFGDAPVRWVDDRKNCMIRFEMPELASGSWVGAVWHSDSDYADPDDMPQGYRVTIDSDNNLNFYIASSGPTTTLLETFPIGHVPYGTVIISCQDDSISVWIGGRFIHTFRDGTWAAGDYAGVVGDAATSIAVSWSNLDRRVDNFIFDMGYAGTQLLSGLIGPKRIYYQDNQYGGLHAFRARADVGILKDLTFRGQKALTDQGLVSRIRSEGYEIAEIADYDKLKQEGNLFGMINATEANDAWEAYQEAMLTLAEKYYEATSLGAAAAADPRVEPNDTCTIYLPDGVYNAIVDSASFDLVNDPMTPLFDMELGLKCTTATPVTYGVTLEADDPTKEGVSEEEVVYIMTIENTGNIPQHFLITQSGATWDTVLSDTEIKVYPGETEEFTVTVTVPEEEPDPINDSVSILVTCEQHPATTDTVVLTTTFALPGCVQDTFTDINGKDLTAHVPDVCPPGAAWAIASGSPTASIQENKVRILDASYSSVGYVIEANLSNCIVKVSMYPNWVNPCGGGVYCRDDGIDRITATMIRASNACYLFDTDGGILDTDTLVRDPADQIDVTVTLSGTSITALFENITKDTSVTLVGISSNNQTATKHGITFMAQWGEGVYDFFDNFSATE